MYLSFQFVIFISLGKKNIMMYTTAKWLLFDKILQKNSITASLTKRD